MIKEGTPAYDLALTPVGRTRPSNEYPGSSDFLTCGTQLEYRQSNIPNAGNGLFTTVPIRKYQQITPYGGEFLNKYEMKKMPSNHRTAYLINLWKNPDIIIDGYGVQHHPELGWGALANTATVTRNNNTSFHEEDAPYNLRTNVNTTGTYVVLTATKDIPAGAELYVYYGTSYWGKAGKPQAPPVEPPPRKIAVLETNHAYRTRSSMATNSPPAEVLKPRKARKSRKAAPPPVAIPDSDNDSPPGSLGGSPPSSPPSSPRGNGGAGPPPPYQTRTTTTTQRTATVTPTVTTSTTTTTATTVTPATTTTVTPTTTTTVNPLANVARANTNAGTSTATTSTTTTAIMPSTTAALPQLTQAQIIQQNTLNQQLVTAQLQYQQQQDQQAQAQKILAAQAQADAIARGSFTNAFGTGVVSSGYTSGGGSTSAAAGGSGSTSAAAGSSGSGGGPTPITHAQLLAQIDAVKAADAVRNANAAAALPIGRGGWVAYWQPAAVPPAAGGVPAGTGGVAGRAPRTAAGRAVRAKHTKHRRGLLPALAVPAQAPAARI